MIWYVWYDEMTPWEDKRMRITRDTMFMEIARIVAKRGTCPRAQVGAVLVTAENNIISIGYNGAPKGEIHCEDVGCKMVDGHCKRSLHAEENALRNKWIIGAGLCTMYVTHKPCDKCIRGIINNGTVTRVVYDIPYRHDGDKSWEQDGVTFEQYDLIHSR